MNHGENVGEGNVDVLALLIGTEAERGGTDERSDVVGVLGSFASRPRHAVLVGEDRSGEGRSVVASPSDEHQTARRRRRGRQLGTSKAQSPGKGDSPRLGDLANGLELEGLLDRLDGVTISLLLDLGRVVGVLGEEGFVGVLEVGAVDGDGLDGATGGRRIDGDGLGGVVVGVARGRGSSSAGAVGSRVVEGDGRHDGGVVELGEGEVELGVSIKVITTCVCLYRAQ